MGKKFSLFQRGRMASRIFALFLFLIMGSLPSMEILAQPADEQLNNEISEVGETACSDEYCSHVFRDLDGNLQAICSEGEAIVKEQKAKEIASERSINTLGDGLANGNSQYEGLYFVSIPNLYNKSKSLLTGPTTFDKIEVTSVYAKYYKNSAIDSAEQPLIYRMMSMEDGGLFGTVLPSDRAYSYVTFEIHIKNGESEDKSDSVILYNYRAERQHPSTEITQEPTNEQPIGRGAFFFQQKIKDCFYWDTSYHTSYWGGHPSTGENILDEHPLYVDNSMGSEPNKTVWDEVWISYVNPSTKKVVSKKVTKETRSQYTTYHLFEKGCGLTELSLIAISNGKLNESGQFENNKSEEQNKIYYQLYNIASGDNLFVLRNLENEYRIWSHFSAEGNRYVAFKDELYGTYGALVSGNSQQQAKGSVQYRICNGENDTPDETTQWINMSQAIPKEGEWGKASEDMKQNVFYKTFFAEQLNDKDEYIQFRVWPNGTPNENESEKTSYLSPVTKINDQYAFPCFFADPLQKKSKTYQSKPNEVTGYWSSIFRANYHGDESRDIPVEINNSYETDYYYADTSFYDYYSDFELQGKNLREANKDGDIGSAEIKGGNYYNYEHSHARFNEAISKYYESKDKQFTNTIPWYFGKDRASAIDGVGLYNAGNPPTPLLNHQIGPNDWYQHDPNKDSIKYAYGFVDKILSNSGNMTSNNIENPLFDESFLRGNNSLHSSIGYVYNNVPFPFFLAKDGYWEYNSLNPDHALRLQEDQDSGYYLKTGATPLKTGDKKIGMGGHTWGFFPLNDERDLHLDANNKENLEKVRTNFGFGMKMNLEFKLTPDGMVRMPNAEGKYEDKPIEFRFSGDDDFILYIDGKLVLDMVGIHNPLEGKIDFKTGDVTVYELKYDEKDSMAYDIYRKEENGKLIEDPKNKHSQSNIYESSEGPQFKKEGLAAGIHKITIFYLERGAGASNLKVRFNFPRISQLDLTNQVDVSTANPDVFGEALSHVGSFTYKIQNQATSGNTVPVENSVGYLKNEGTVTFNNFEDEKTYRGKEGEVELTSTNNTDKGVVGDRKQVIKLKNHETKKQLDLSQMITEIASGKYWTTIDCAQPGGTVDLSKAAYLQMSVYNGSSWASATGKVLQARLIDANGHTITQSADQMLYHGYSNSLPKRQWSTVRLDLNAWNNEINDFDITKVSKIQFALANDGGILYIDDLDFKGKIIQNQLTGFYASDNQISDFESIVKNENDRPDYDKSELKPVRGAFFRLNPIEETEIAGPKGKGNDLMVRENGLLELSGGYKASFIDKFREGSYLKIEQKDPLRNEVFRTRWSILENAEYDSQNGVYKDGWVSDNYLALHPNAITVENDPNILNNTITNVETLIASDDRTVRKEDGSGYIYPSTNRNPSESGKNDTIVFQSYLDPDNPQKNEIHLTVAYENQLRNGGVIITKEVDENDIDKNKDHTYKFHIHYTDVAGMNLESNIGSGSVSDEKRGIVQEVEVVIPAGEKSASIGIYGIPKNTIYTIHEVNEIPTDIKIDGCTKYPDKKQEFVVKNPQEGSTLPDNSSSIHNAKAIEKNYDVDGVDVTYKAVEGTVKESVQKVTFKNKQIPSHGEIKITKKLDGNAFTEDKTYLFHIHYKDSQENISVIPQTVVVKKGETEGSTVYENIPLNAQYEIHEVDDSMLKGVIASEKSTTLGTDEPIGEEGKEHKNVVINKNSNITMNQSTVVQPQTQSPIDCSKITTTVAKGKAGESRHNFTFTNSGAHHLILFKKDKETNEPIPGVGFTLYEKENILKHVDTKYVQECDLASQNGGEKFTSGVYKDASGTIYPVYELKTAGGGTKTVYYVPLTAEEIKAYREKTMNEAERQKVYCVSQFTDLKESEYTIKETGVPVGYSGIDPIENLTLPLSSPETTPLILPFNVKFISAETNAKNVALEVVNEKNEGQFSFIKQSKDGDPLADAKFALYRRVCTDTAHAHDKLLKCDEAGALTDNGDKACWKFVKTAVSDQAGKVLFSNLVNAPGVEYRLVELAAPKGYVTPKGQWKVTGVEDSNDVNEPKKVQLQVTGSIGNPPAFSGSGTEKDPYKLNNYTYADFPLSGGSGYNYIAGIVLVAVGMCLWIWYRCRKQKLQPRRKRRVRK